MDKGEGSKTKTILWKSYVHGPQGSPEKEGEGETRESIVEGQSCRSVEGTMRKIRMRRGSGSRTHKDTTLFDSQEKDTTLKECLT